MTTLKYIWIPLLYAVISCKEYTSTLPAATYADTIPRTILYSEDSAAKESSQEPFVTNLAKLMRLPTITNGSKELYVRIWIWDDSVKYVVNIQKDGSGGTCDIVEFNSKKIDATEFIVMHRVKQYLHPASGWDRFFKSLDQYQITTLKSGKPYKDQTDLLTHMSVVQFEIAQPGQYRYYEYLEPSYYRYVDSGSAKVDAFLEYFDKEMKTAAYSRPDGRKLFAEPK